MIKKGYYDFNSGQIHFASRGTKGPRIVLLHESPLSHRIYFSVAENIASWGQVFIPDTPGYGQSTPLRKEADLTEYAEALISAIQQWSNGEKVIVGGIHTGASLSVEIANQAPNLCRGVVLIGLPTYTDEMRESRIKNYAPSIDLKTDGSHLIWAWERYRNMWPTAPIVHTQLAVADLIYNIERYNWAYLQAFKYPAEERIKNIHCPIFMSAASGEFLFEGTKNLAEEMNLEFHAFPGVDGQGQVSLRNASELNQTLRKFSDSIPS